MVWREKPALCAPAIQSFSASLATGPLHILYPLLVALSPLPYPTSVPQLNFFVIFVLFRAAPMVYGGSQARGPIGAVVASLHQSHSNARSEPLLQPTPQLTAMPDC